MKAFMDRDFLLENETARTLFHKYAENQPIYDYHNHLPPREIAERKQYENLTQLWLAADHYKWRAMRACGVDERYITGDAPEYRKFQKWAEVVPQLVGCPLYHWAHLELQRYFEIYAPLTPETAPAIWEETKEKLKAYDAVSLLEKMNVRVLCTTDDPADTLEWHKKIAADPTIPFHVLPSFRPDNYLGGNPEAKRALCEKYGTDSLPEALGKALDYFCENGCKVSDHGFSRFAYIPGTKQAELLHVLGKAYHAHGVAMQLHLGPIRNQNPRLLAEVGPDAGGDSVGLTTDPFQLGAFLGDLARENSLPNTILYNLNPTDNAVLSTMAVNFAPKVQFGAAWWFNDTIRGMRRQIDELMEIMRSLAAEGKSILFISHKLNEIMAVADRCTVLRKGRCIGTVDVKNTTKEELSRMMVGRDVDFVVHKDEAKPKEIVLSAEGVCVESKLHKHLAVKNVSFNVRAGEIVCIAGIDGNGQTELVYGITGLEPLSAGKVQMCGKDITAAPIRKRSRLGMSHIPEDRHKHGLVLDYSLEYNMILQRYFEPQFVSPAGFLKRGAIREYSDELIRQYDVRSGQGSVTVVRSMSGGNQQKAIVARELDKKPKLLVAVQPTRGLDVGAIEFIHKRLVEQRDNGAAVLLISLELDEVMNLSDRILVMYEGEIVGELDPKKTTVEELGLYMAGAKRGAEYGTKHE